VRALALHPDVLLVSSAIWQTNCAIVRSGEECFVIDSPVLPAELDALPALLEQAGYPKPSGALVTHGDWDHMLGRLAFPGSSLGCAEDTAARMSAAPGEAQRELRRFDEEHLIERARPLSLGAVQPLPVPGRCEIGEHRLELHPARGHTDDGMAIWVPWARVLLAGDYLSTVEIPSVEGSLEDYLQTLERLQALARDAAHVIPGHGPVLDPDAAERVIGEDRGYLSALAEHGEAAELPLGRRGRMQRAQHARNAAHIAAVDQP
jgi:glyoxylase-like metal-dependent hydrolase (beta-lactamase superfamily II)